jgi:hypothetical protein
MLRKLSTANLFDFSLCSGCPEGHPEPEIKEGFSIR